MAVWPRSQTVEAGNPSFQVIQISGQVDLVMPIGNNWVEEGRGLSYSVPGWALYALRPLLDG